MIIKLSLFLFGFLLKYKKDISGNICYIAPGTGTDASTDVLQDVYLEIYARKDISPP